MSVAFLLCRVSNPSPFLLFWLSPKMGRLHVGRGGGVSTVHCHQDFPFIRSLREGVPKRPASLSLFPTFCPKEGRSLAFPIFSLPRTSRPSLRAELPKERSLALSFRKKSRPSLRAELPKETSVALSSRRKKLRAELPKETSFALQS